jgi:ABC-type nitrate/sulfonate/bicarbonate transport system permease component
MVHVAERATTTSDRKVRKRRQLRIRQVVYTWGSVLAGLALWQIISEYVVKNTLFLATPIAAIGAMGTMWASGDLPRARRG